MQETDPRLLRNDDFASVRGKFAGDHGEERTLAGAVRPDDADPFPFFHAEGGVVENIACPVVL